MDSHAFAWPLELVTLACGTPRSHTEAWESITSTPEATPMGEHPRRRARRAEI